MNIGSGMESEVGHKGKMIRSNQGTSCSMDERIDKFQVMVIVDVIEMKEWKDARISSPLRQFLPHIFGSEMIPQQP